MLRLTPACLLAMVNLTFLCLYCPTVQADEQPTRDHQLLSPCDYIPLKRQAGTGTGEQPVLTATINGQTVMVMADTGGSFCILSPEIAKQLNLALGPSFLNNGKPFIWKGKQITDAFVSGFKVSNVSFSSKMQFEILPDQDFMLNPKAPDDTHFDGIVGANLLEHFAVLVDGPQHRFGLCLPGNLFLKQVADYGLTQPYIVPITKKDDGRWYVEAQITNAGMTVTESLVLDTGSNVTQLSDTAAQSLHLKIIGQQSQQTLYQTRIVGQTNVETLRFGDLTLSGTMVSFSPVTKEQPPVLGMDILSGYRVLIDFPGKKMYLQPYSVIAPPTPIVPPPPSAGQAPPVGTTPPIGQTSPAGQTTTPSQPK